MSHHGSRLDKISIRFKLNSELLVTAFTLPIPCAVTKPQEDLVIIRRARLCGKEEKLIQRHERVKDIERMSQKMSNVSKPLSSSNSVLCDVWQEMFITAGKAYCYLLKSWVAWELDLGSSTTFRISLLALSTNESGYRCNIPHHVACIVCYPSPWPLALDVVSSVMLLVVLDNSIWMSLQHFRLSVCVARELHMDDIASNTSAVGSVWHMDLDIAARFRLIVRIASKLAADLVGVPFADAPICLLDPHGCSAS